MAKTKMTYEDKKFRDWLRKTQTGVAADMKQSLAKYTAKIQGKAIDWCPVDTGYLRSTISMQILYGGTVGVVRVGAKYARYVELGTYRTYAQPFLLPAYNVYSEQFIEELIDILDKYVRG